MNPAYLLIDAACLFVVLVASFRHLSFLHPLSAYLFFHVYSFSSRAWQIFLGAPTLYSVGYSSKYEPIALDEIQRALLIADIGLVAFAFGCHVARTSVQNAEQSGGLAPWRPYYQAPTFMILGVSIAIGTALFVSVRGGETNLDFGGLATYAGVATIWPITGLIALYFITGRFWSVALPCAIYLSIVGLQGFHRFMLVLPVISLFGVYLYHRRAKWPPLGHWLAIAALALIFPSLKRIGRAVQEGDYQYAMSEAKAAITGQGGSGLTETESGFLDQFAGFLTLCDRYGKWEYGKTWTRILVLPIPRAWWPGKPGLADHLAERSTEARPYALEGKITTYLGESYVNFWFPGIVFVPFLLAYGLGVLYERYTRLPNESLAALIYIFISATFVQAYRDGLTSVLLFGLVFNMPLIFVWLVHLGVRKRPFAQGMQRPLG